MTEIDTAALRALCERATDGPWELCDRGDYDDFDGNSRVILGDDMRVAVVHDHGTGECAANAELIGLSRTTIPALLDEIDRLRAENERLRENHEIVARIWRQLGSPTYEQLAGRSIYDLIDELKAKAEPPRLRSKIVSRDIPIITLPEEK